MYPKKPDSTCRRKKRKKENKINASWQAKWGTVRLSVITMTKRKEHSVYSLHGGWRGLRTEQREMRKWHTELCVCVVCERLFQPTGVCVRVCESVHALCRSSTPSVMCMYVIIPRARRNSLSPLILILTNKSITRMARRGFSPLLKTGMIKYVCYMLT